VPIGVPGCIGGVGLAPGLLHELNEQRYSQLLQQRVRNPPLQNWDLARCHLNGNIEFIGRIDPGVKIRGFRIELKLRQH